MSTHPPDGTVKALAFDVFGTVVVVLPSPAGVGLIAVTRISLPFFRLFRLSMYSSDSLVL